MFTWSVKKSDVSNVFVVEEQDRSEAIYNMMNTQTDTELEEATLE